MPNQNVNKVIYGGRVLIDLTGDTVDPSKLLKGSKAHDKSGAQNLRGRNYPLPELPE